MSVLMNVEEVAAAAEFAGAAEADGIVPAAPTIAGI
jgi:hypothetical protein